MTVGASSVRTTTLIRHAAVGSLLPPSVLEGRGSRRLEATAFILPGRGELGGYLACPECGVLDDPTDRDWVP